MAEPDQSPTVFQDWGIFYKSLTVWFILTLIFAHPNLAKNVNPNLGPLFDCNKVTPLGIFDYPTLTNCDHNISNIKETIQT